MAQKVINTWFPDSCGCHINYEWDRDSPLTTRVHSYHDEVKCGKHPQLSERNCGAHGNMKGSALYEAVRGENGRKNLAVNAVLVAKGVTRDKYPDGAKGDRVFSEDLNDALLDIDFVFDPTPDQTGQRPVHLKVRASPNLPYQALQAQMDSTHGKGKVFIEQA